MTSYSVNLTIPSKQPRGEFASADQIARESDEEVQVSRPGTTIPLCLWTDLITFSSWQTSLLSQWLSRSNEGQILDLERCHRGSICILKSAIIDRYIVILRISR